MALDAKKPLPAAGRGRRWRVWIMDLLILALLLCWIAVAVTMIYPRYLTHTAPEEALAYIATPAERAAAELTVQQNATQRLAVYETRDHLWQRALMLLQGAGTLLMYGAVLLWRLHVRRHALPYGRQCRRAVHTYRVTALLVLALEAGLALLTWWVGLRFVGGRTGWDYVCCFALYPLAYGSCIPLCRLGAPDCLSGRHAFFRRL